MNMKIGDTGLPPMPLDEVGKAHGAEKAQPTPGGPALTIEHADPGKGQAAGGPLGIEDLLPAPDFDAPQRVVFGGGTGASSSTTATAPTTGAAPTLGTAPTTDPDPTTPADLTTKVDPNTADSNAMMAAMMKAGLAMIQAQQESGKAEDTERKSDLSSYESKMDSAVQDLKDAASDTWNAALTEGVLGITGSVVSMVGIGMGTSAPDGSAGAFERGMSLTGNIIGSSGKIGGGAFSQAATDKEGDEKTAEKFAGVFQSASQNAAQYRDTYYQTQSTVIQALQQVVQGEGAAEQSAASGRA